jgi:transglutaminase-like putative cysteine protease
MARPIACRARALLTALAGGTLALGTTAGAAVAPTQWEVTFALRISGGTGAPVALRLALPADTPLQQIAGVVVTARGLQATVVREGEAPYALLEGKVKGARRVAVTYSVHRTRLLAAVPAVQPVLAPPPELQPYLDPTPAFQSRSILAREFLAREVTPLLNSASNVDVMRAIFQAVREHLAWDSRGKSAALDVLRSGTGNRIGLERTFTTLLRAAHIPARLVEGINLNSSTPHKRVFWTLVWAQNQWWPVSASRGWIGREPTSYIALARDGRRVLSVEGSGDASYAVQAVPVGIGR